MTRIPDNVTMVWQICGGIALYNIIIYPLHTILYMDFFYLSDRPVGWRIGAHLHQNCRWPYLQRTFLSHIPWGQGDAKHGISIYLIYNLYGK